eukprot:scaffold2816_cov121-Cylindrotheca_fusiformis.AAC.61
MGKKPRSHRRKKGDTDNIDAVDDVEELSLSHTIVTVGTEAGDSIFSKDEGWSIDDDAFEEFDGDSARVAEAWEQKLQDSLAMADEFSTEKRTARREATLRQWFKALTQYAFGSYETVESKLGDIIRACQFSVRSGTPSEQYAACRVLEATSVLISDEEFFERVYSRLLLRVVQSSHRAIPVRIAALRAIGMTVFIGVDDDVVTEQILDLCEALAQPEYRGETVPPVLRAAALEVWNLLATKLDALYISGKDDVSTGRGLMLLDILVECLEQQEEFSLQSAAGECVALIHTARLQVGLDSEEGENTTERKFCLGSWEGSEWEDTMSEIEQLMEMLSNQSGHFLSKKRKKDTRSVFRELLATIQDNEPPHQVIQFQGGSLDLQSWKDIIALNFVRRCLQGALQIQLLTNPTLQAIFGADGKALHSSNGGYSQVEKRLFLSKSSEAAKSKDLDRSKKRRSRANAKNLFLTNDDE